MYYLTPRISMQRQKKIDNTTASQDLVLLQHGLQSSGVNRCVCWQLVDDVGQIGEQVALILICKDGGNACVVELDVLVGHAHEVHGRVLGDERVEGVGDELGDFALREGC